MRPATPSLGREVTEDVTIDDGRGRQFTLAKGTKVGLSLYSAGMSPANGWSDPGKLDPLSFAPCASAPECETDQRLVVLGGGG